MLPVSATAPRSVTSPTPFQSGPLFLSFARELFVLAFGCQIGVIGDPARLFFDGALRLMNIAFISSFVLWFIWFLLVAFDVM
jgi:hypothetical protein